MSFCEECRCSSGMHINGCPEQPEEKPIYKCSYCEEGIFVDDFYKDFGNNLLCYSCLQELNPEELLKLADNPIQTAQPPMEGETE